MKGLDKVPIFIPFAHGLNTRADERALEAPSLTVCENVEFDEWGGLQHRKPWAPETYVSGAANASIRRITSWNDQLVAFSKDAIYSYAGSGVWSEIAPYHAIKIEQDRRFVTNAEQTDCDRAELSGVVMYSWVQDINGTATAYIAAINKVTGAVLLAPEAIKASTTRARLVATSNRICCLFRVDSGTSAYWARFYNPSDLSSPVEAAIVSGAVTASQGGYDLVADGTDVVFCYGNGADNTVKGHRVDYVTPSSSDSFSFAQTNVSGTPCAIAHESTGDSFAIFSVNSGTAAISGTLLDATLTVGTTYAVATASGTTVEQMTAVFKDTQDSSQYRCYVFWSVDHATTGNAAGNFELEYDWLDDGGTGGTADVLCYGAGVASHAFLYNGVPHVWCAYAAESNVSGMSAADKVQAQLQNSYFLYSIDDGLLAKAVAPSAGGFANTSGHLPTVQAVGTDNPPGVTLSYSNQFAWCGVERLRITTGSGGKAYAQRSPVDVVFTFDSDEARRSVQLGGTLYIAGGQISQFDGEDVTEVGFHTFPTEGNFTEGSGGNIAASTDFGVKSTYSWFNAAGEFERSTTATTNTVTTTASASREILSSVYYLRHTQKTAAGRKPSVEFWRTTGDPVENTPYYLASSRDPSTSGDNDYVPNDEDSVSIPTFYDAYSDATLSSQESDPESAGILESTAPPPATIIAADQNRLFLAGIPGRPHRVVYSKYRDEGYVASFNDQLFFDLPAEGGAITAISFLNENLIVFKERAIYQVPGDGFTNTGAGFNYGPPRLLSNDVGATKAELVAYTPKGLMFHSAKGWHILNHGWSVNYIGQATYDAEGTDFGDIHVDKNQHQVRVIYSPNNTASVYVWDWLRDEWSHWDSSSGLGDSTVSPVAATTLAGTHYLADSDFNVWSQASDWSTYASNNMQLETSWIRIGDIQGMQRARWLMILGEFRSNCEIRVRVAYDYDDTWVDDNNTEFTTGGGYTAGDPLQLRHGFHRQKHQAFKVEVTVRNTDATYLSTEGVKLTGMTVELGMKKGAYKYLAAASKQ